MMKITTRTLSPTATDAEHKTGRRLTAVGGGS
jgi:hypothetical protein